MKKTHFELRMLLRNTDWKGSKTWIKIWLWWKWKQNSNEDTVAVDKNVVNKSEIKFTKDIVKNKPLWLKLKENLFVYKTES